MRTNARLYDAGKREIKLTILPEAELLGLTQADLAAQVREAFYGAEVQRIQRGSHEIRVMVRYPESERRSIGDLEGLMVRTADGAEVPFSSVARAELGHGYATIQRGDRKRVVAVTADVDRTVTTPEEVLASVTTVKIPEILDRYPDVSYSLEGEQRERNRSMAGLAKGFLIALLMIVGLLAIPLRSYIQPLVIMSAIPFGAIGAVLGHLVMNWDLVFFSILGIVALSGVVVNDSLVLVDYINRKRREGVELIEAVKDGWARALPADHADVGDHAGRPAAADVQLQPDRLPARTHRDLARLRHHLRDHDHLDPGAYRLRGRRDTAQQEEDGGQCGGRVAGSVRGGHRGLSSGWLDRSSGGIETSLATTSLSGI